MALFGYDPVKYLLGRGVLEAVGIGVELTDRDVAARGNFATVDSQGPTSRPARGTNTHGGERASRRSSG